MGEPRVLTLEKMLAMLEPWVTDRRLVRPSHFYGRLDFRPFLPKEEPARTIIERWLVWGWNIGQAAYGHASAGRASIEEWINGPLVEDAFGSIGLVIYRETGPYPFPRPSDITPFRRIIDDPPPPPGIDKMPSPGLTWDVRQKLKEQAYLEREATALRMRRDGQTLRAIGEQLGVSRERVRQIVAKAERRQRFAAIRRVRIEESRIRYRAGTWVEHTPETTWRETEGVTAPDTPAAGPG